MKKNNKKIILFLLVALIVFIIFIFMFNKPKYTLTIKYDNSLEDVEVELKHKERYELEKVTKKGYNFDEWKIEGKGSKIEDNVFIMGTEDTVITAVWEKVSYKISYDLNGGTQGENVVTTYTDTTDTFDLPVPVKNGYSFEGWYTDSDYSSEVVVKVEEGSTGNRAYYAKWEPVVYKVTYNLNGGTVNEELVQEYTVESESFKLSNPTRKDYIFIGWSGGDLKTRQTNVVVEKGSYNNKEFIANWKPITYDIKYNTNEGNLPKDAVKSFTANTAYFKLPEPSRNGYTFVGWYDNKEFNGKIIEGINKGTRENKEFYAKWDVTVYDIKYELDNGVVDEELPSTYTITSDEITLLNPSKDHYVFTGWTGSNGDKLSKKVIIKKGSYGNKEFVANYKPIDYKITYNLDGGKLEDGIDSYNIETETFELIEPTKKGYNFVGWYTDEEFTSDVVKEIEIGTTGDKEYYAKWEAIVYTIEYELNGGEQDSDITLEYTILSDTFSLPLPSKDGYLFKGWYLKKDFSDDAKIEIKQGSVGNKKYYAKWEKYKEVENVKLYDVITSKFEYDNKESLFVNNKDGIDFFRSSSITNGQGVYMMGSTKKDEYPIYYYRGAVENNNVYFDNYCWKALRTTDTGGIKLLFNGVKNGDGTCDNTGTDTMASISNVYNAATFGIAGAGYSYTDTSKLKLTVKNDKSFLKIILASDVTYDEETGLYTLSDDRVTMPSKTADFTAQKDKLMKEHHYTCLKTTDAGCSSVYFIYMTRNAQFFYATLTNGMKIEDLLNLEFEGNSTNVTKSNIQKVAETWFENNLLDVEEQIEDTVYCNDRTLYNAWSPTSSVANNNDLKMHFGSKARVAYTGNVSVECKHKADSFTTSVKNGNGVLSYPIGLITFDEAALAGYSWAEGGKESFIYNGKVWWTMTPGFVSATGIYNGIISSGLDHVSTDYTSNGAGGFRPIISLKNNAKVLRGDGSFSNPYVIE